MNTLLVCPNCNCFKQENCMSTIGIELRNTFRCTTCDEVYQNQNGIMVSLRSGDIHKHKEVV